MRITKNQLKQIIKEETEGALNESMLNFGLAVKGAKDTANWARERDGRQNSPRSTSAIVKDLAGLVGKKKKKKTWMQQRGDLAQDIAKEIREIDVGEDIKDGLIQAAEILAHGRSEFWAKSLIDMVEQIVLLSDEVTPPEVMKKQGEKYKEDRSRLVRLFPLLDDLLPVVEEANEYAPKMPQRFISKGNLEERKGSQVMKLTKNQLRKIIKEEIKKTLSEAPKPNEKPDWLDQEDWKVIQDMDQKTYDAFFADAIAQRAEEEELSPTAGLAKAKKLEQEFLADPKIADLLDLGAKTKVNAGGLWVGLPSRSKPGKVSTDGLNTADELHSKFIESDWSTTRDITRSGWVKVTKVYEPRDTWTDPDPHGRYVPGEKAPRLSPWEE